MSGARTKRRSLLSLLLGGAGDERSRGDRDVARLRRDRRRRERGQQSPAQTAGPRRGARAGVDRATAAPPKRAAPTAKTTRPAARKGAASGKSARANGPQTTAARSGAKAATGAKRTPVPKLRRRQPTEAQLRERARKRRLVLRRLRLVALVAVLAGVGVAWYAVPRMALFDVRHVEVVGASAVSDLQVRGRVDPLIAGQTIYTVDRGAMQRRVEELPFVASARVDRHFPGGLSITVTEYQPLALALAGNTAWLVARDGRVLTQTRFDDWRDRIPVVRLQHTTVRPGDRVGDEPALHLLRETPPTFPGVFRAVNLTPRDGFVGYLQDGPEVRFGRDSDLARKLLVAERLLTLYGPQRRGGLQYVDVSVPARPAVR